MAPLTGVGVSSLGVLWGKVRLKNGELGELWGGGLEWVRMKVGIWYGFLGSYNRALPFKQGSLLKRV